MGVCTSMYEYMGGQRKTSRTFLCPSLLCCLETGSLIEIELNISARLDDQQALRIYLHPHTRLFMWVVGIKTQVLGLTNQVLLPTDDVLLPGLWNNSL